GPHGEVGNVVEQQADVRCAVNSHRLEQRGARRAGAHPLRIRPRLVFEEERGVGVGGASLDVIAEQAHYRAVTVSVSRPERSTVPGVAPVGFPSSTMATPFTTTRTM